MVRAEAFLEAGGLREHLPLRYARWDLWNAVLVSGWTALAYPGVLATSGSVRPVDATDEAMVQVLRERFATEFPRDADTVRSLETLPGGRRRARAGDFLKLPLRDKVGLALDAIRQPRRALGWLREHWPRKSR